MIEGFCCFYVESFSVFGFGRVFYVSVEVNWERED